MIGVKNWKFRNSFPSVDKYLEKVKDKLYNEYEDSILQLIYYYMLVYYEADVAYYSPEIFELEHARKLDIHLPQFLKNKQVMEAINVLALDKFNLENEVSREGVREDTQIQTGTGIQKRNDTPKMGAGIDLLSDEYISQSMRNTSENEASNDAHFSEIAKVKNSEYVMLREAFKSVDYRFIENFVELFRYQFISIHIGSEFYQ